MSSALNLDDYTRDFMVKVGNLDDFSRELLVKLARTMKIEPKYVVDYLDLANLSIDGTLGYGGDQIVINPDHAMLNLGNCDDHEQ